MDNSNLQTLPATFEGCLGWAAKEQLMDRCCFGSGNITGYIR